MYTLIIDLDTKKKIPLYKQIYEYIRMEIIEGKLPYKEQLPSTRSLAGQLQVSRSTVDLAYDQLVSEGYIEAKPCKGYFVSQVEELYDGRWKKEEKEEKEESSYREEKRVTYDFTPNGIDMSCFPYNVWRKITNQIMLDHERELFQMGDPMGDFPLRQTIAKYLHSSRMVNCKAEQIIIGAGNDYLLMLLSKVLGEGQKIAMENVTYKRAYDVLKSMNHRIFPVEMDKRGMDLSSLEKTGASIAYVMPAHQFPLGIVMPIGRRMELLQWALEREERYVIEDDYDSEFRYRGKPIPVLQAWDQHEKVIYMGTFSKSIAPAIRISYMVLPGRLLLRFKEVCNCYASTVSRIDQRILYDFMQGGHFERHLNRMRKLYKGKHDRFLTELQSFGDRIVILGENAGLHLVILWKEKEAEEIIKKGEEAMVKLYPLTGNYIGQEKKYENMVIAGYGGLKEEEIVKGIQILKDALAM